MISYWEKTLYDQKYDVIIIGGGITGISTGIALLKAKSRLKILILEKEHFGTNATSRNAGFACIGSPSELLGDLNNYGLDNVHRNLKMRYEGLQMLFKNVSKKKVEYKNFGGYDVFTSSQSAAFEETSASLIALNHIANDITGLKDLYTLYNQLPLSHGFSENISGLIKINYESQLNSMLVLNELEKRYISLGGLIAKGIKVSSSEPVDSHHEVITDKYRFHTSKILYATNGFTNSIISSPEVISPGRGIILVTRPLKKVQLRGNFHAEAGYVYFRNLGNRILIGGGRNQDFAEEQTTEPGINPRIRQYLIKYLQENVNCQEGFEIEHEWSGIMGFTESKLPVIKEISPGVFVAAGLNGIGMAIGSFVAKEASKLILEC